MQESEGLGMEGWIALALILLGVVMAVGLGFSGLLYLALLLTIVVFAAILGLCSGAGRKA